MSWFLKLMHRRALATTSIQTNVLSSYRHVQPEDSDLLTAIASLAVVTQDSTSSQLTDAVRIIRYRVVGSGAQGVNVPQEVFKKLFIYYRF
jgi:hypothetical protein